jgi:hypothetical protein
VFDKAHAQFDLEAGHNMSEALIAAVRQHPIRFGESVVGQCAERREAVQIADLTQASPHPLYDMHVKSGVHALLAVPLLHLDEVIGALVVRRKRAGSLPSKPSACCNPSPASRRSPSKTRGCFARLKTSPTSLNWRASTSHSSSPT